MRHVNLGLIYSQKDWSWIKLTWPTTPSRCVVGLSSMLSKSRSPDSRTTCRSGLRGLAAMYAQISSAVQPETFTCESRSSGTLSVMCSCRQSSQTIMQTQAQLDFCHVIRARTLLQREWDWAKLAAWVPCRCKMLCRCLQVSCPPADNIASMVSRCKHTERSSAISAGAISCRSGSGG